MGPRILSPLRQNARLIFAYTRPCCRAHSTQSAASASTSPSASQPPLRILFCGADEFSIAALTAVHREACQRTADIASIDVVCRPPKKVGAGLKRLREVPIKQAAEDLALPIHEIDTFTGWKPPSPQGHAINLVIAVSFGLFIPPRILRAAPFGGINLHPSLLPDFRGPAPLHHVLLSGEKRTGITLQTLHPEKFDHGVVLAQDAFDVPNNGVCGVGDLLELVCARGARMMADALRNRTFGPRLVGEDEKARSSSCSSSSSSSDLSAPQAPPAKLRHAPKITKEDAHLDWTSWTAETIALRQRVLHPLWNFASIVPSALETLTHPHPQSQAQSHSQMQPGEPAPAARRRIIFEHLEPVPPDTPEHDTIAMNAGTHIGDLAPGVPFTIVLPEQTQQQQQAAPLFVFSADRQLFRVDRVKVEGRMFAPARSSALQAKMMPTCLGAAGPVCFFDRLH